MSELDDAREELLSLTASTRALVLQLRDSGAEELPMTPRGAAARATPPLEPPPPSGDGRLVRAPAQHEPPARPEPQVEAQPTQPTHAQPQAPAPMSGQPFTPKPTPRAAPPEPPPRMLVAREGQELDLVQRGLRLETLASEVAACVRCPLHATRTQTVFSRGNPAAELMFVGEGPGAEEDAQGLPFVGKAGELLDKMIGAMGYARDDVYIANVLKCRPPGNRKPEATEMASCEAYLQKQIDLVQPRVIVALGATAIEGLLKVSGITKLRGTWRLYRGEIPVMPTFHPAYLLRTPADKRLVWADLQQVMVKLGKK